MLESLNHCKIRNSRRFALRLLALEVSTVGTTTICESFDGLNHDHLQSKLHESRQKSVYTQFYNRDSCKERFDGLNQDHLRCKLHESRQKSVQFL